MKIQKYKPGKYISSSSNKNNYCQSHWFDELRYKGCRNNRKFIGYCEDYSYFMDKGIKYRI
jgi:hypothetical protein